MPALPMMRRFATCGVLAALLFAACSSSTPDSKTTKGKQYVNGLVAGFDKDQANGGSRTFTRSEVGCLAKKLVDAIGVKTLEKYGVTPTNAGSDNGVERIKGRISSDQRDKVAAAFLDGDCYDAVKLFTKQFAQSMHNMPGSAASCAAKEALKNTDYRNALAYSVVGKGDADPFVDPLKKQLHPVWAKCHIDESKIGA